MTSNFGRVITAMATPFDKNGKVDIPRAIQLAEKLAAEGSDGLVIHGTTGESPTVSTDEANSLYRAIRGALGSRITLIAGTGSNSTQHTIENTKQAEEAGVDAALVVVPYYNKPSQAGMIAHFTAVAAATKLPIMIYNIPGRTGVNMLPETVLALSKVRNITSIKESSGNLDQIGKVRAITPPDFLVYSGDDNLTLPIIQRGGCGVVSVASHIVGPEIQKMVGLALEGKTAEAEKIHNELMPIFSVLFITANPTPLKAALEMIGFPVGGLRLPLIEANAEEKEKIRAVLKQLKKLEAVHS